MNRVDTIGLTRVVTSATSGIPYWSDFIRSLGSIGGSRIGVHLAVLVEPYLEFILQGRKTVESRFSIHRVAPYRQVGQHDVILLKRAGGPIVGVCQAENVWFYKLTPTSLDEIASRFGRAICPVDDQFWTDRRHAGYATLIKLSRVHRTEPLAFPKKDRRGWVVLKHSELQDTLFMEPIVIGLAGPVASGKSSVGRKLAESLQVPFGSFGRAVRSIAKKNGMSDRRGELQKIGQHMVNTEPLKLCQGVLRDSGWAPGMSAVIEGFRHSSIVDIMRAIVSPVPFRLVYIDLDLKTELLRTSLSAPMMMMYQSDPTEIEVPHLRNVADIRITGTAPIESNVLEIRKALGMNDGE
jgi:hypothetical protein